MKKVTSKKVNELKILCNKYRTLHIGMTVKDEEASSGHTDCSPTTYEGHATALQTLDRLYPTAMAATKGAASLHIGR